MIWRLKTLKKNICIIGLATNFTKTIAKTLADKLDMFYADINDLLRFDLLDINEAKKLAGKNYILKLETSKIKTVASYENTIITLNYSSLTNNENFEILKRECLIIYLKLTKSLYEKHIEQDKLTKSQKAIALTVFKDRDFISQNVTDIMVKVNTKNESKLQDIILEEITHYYNK